VGVGTNLSDSGNPDPRADTSMPPTTAATPAHAFWVIEPGRGAIRPEPLAPAQRGDALVRTLFSGISRGTESLVFRGEVPESEHQRMRAPFQDGDFPGPLKYGYCNVGLVEEGPPALIGRRVFCLYPHQTRYRVPAPALTPVPMDIPPGRAVLAANLETAINGLWDACPRLGDRITVVGAGTLGCLCARLAAGIPGCAVQLIDVNPRRAGIAAALGARFAVPGEAEGDQDLVIHASGASEGLALGLELAAFESSIVELSWYGTHEVSLPLGRGFHQRRLTLRSSQVGSVAADQRARWDHARRMGLALELLRDPVLDQLITGEDPFERLPEVQARLASDPGETLMHRIRYGEGED
jgi:threonine dehydrogenase-like Zn-dependent dehydrogenase